MELESAEEIPIGTTNIKSDSLIKKTYYMFEIFFFSLLSFKVRDPYINRSILPYIIKV